MKKVIILIFSLVLFSSCQITEEITLDKNGSGTYDVSLDMRALADIFKGMKSKDSIKKNKIPKKIDTIFKISEMFKKFKDSVDLSEKDKEDLEKLNDLVMHFKIDEKKGELFFGFKYPFKQLKDLETFYDDFKAVQKLDKKSNVTKNKFNSDMTSGLEQMKVKYKMTRRYFKRKVASLDKVKKETGQNSSETKENEMENPFAGMMQYRFVYHFPKKIKKVKFDGEYKLSDDSKTLIIEMPLDVLSKHPEKSSFEVRFKN